jgi:hypothetical protein
VAGVGLACISMSLAQGAMRDNRSAPRRQIDGD